MNVKVLMQGWDQFFCCQNFSVRNVQHPHIGNVLYSVLMKCLHDYFVLQLEISKVSMTSIFEAHSPMSGTKFGGQGCC